jgi:hypothetical protein
MIFITFSCFVMQSLKLHVLKLTKNIDDLKLQLVSYLFSMFSFYSFFHGFMFLFCYFYADLPNLVKENYVLFSWFRLKTRRQTISSQLMNRDKNL